MIEQNRGNCFSLSEYLCASLVALPEVLAAGIGIEVLHSRRNYHAFNWACLCGDSRPVRLDLLLPFPERLENSRGLRPLLPGLSICSERVLYRSSNVGVNEETLTCQALARLYHWPLGDGGHEQVFLGARAGIAALHVLAQEGGTRRLLPPLQEPTLPALPRR